MAKQMRVLIGYDGSACADAALDDLRRAGLPGDAQFKIVSVVENWLPPPSGMEIALNIDRDQEYLRMATRAFGRLKEMGPGWEVKTEVHAGSPSAAIVELADEWKPDLIIVGSHGRTALGRFFLGSVSHKVLHEAHCSVRIARGRIEEPGTPLRLIIGVDGSKGSEAAVQAVIARNWPLGCEARVVNAAWSVPKMPNDYMAGQVIDWYNKEEKRIKEAVNTAVIKLTEAGLKTDAIVKIEEPKQLLTSEAEKWGADCIFVGAKGMSRLERLLIGSVSSAVAAQAQCSVEAVRV